MFALLGIYLAGVASAFIALDVASRRRAARELAARTDQACMDLDAEFREFTRRRRATERLSSGRCA